ncbi:MAG: NAD-dependent epimerase/dehydratase family protein [Thermoprotei archaeon]
MRILVTGGAGFIGSYTVDLLVEKGYKVRVLDNLEPQVHYNKKPDYLNPEAEYIWGDVKRKKDWLEALKDVDGIIHLAALVGVAQSMYQPTRYLIANSIGTANMYEILLKKPRIRKNIKKIIVASSKSIYGEGAYKCKTHGIVYPNLRSREQLEKKDWEMHCPLCDEYVKPIGITEEKPAQNLSIYALSKYDTERIAVNLGFAMKIPTIALRYFNVYGPRQSLNNPYTGVVAIFLSRIKNNNPPIVFEDGHQLRDFIYVEDIARANILALENDKTGIYNVGTGKPTSILDIAKTLINLFGSHINPKITEEFRIGDNRHDFADISKIKRDFNFEPKWNLKEGLQKLIEWGETQEAIDMFETAEKERKKYLK